MTAPPAAPTAAPASAPPARPVASPPTTAPVAPPTAAPVNARSLLSVVPHAPSDSATAAVSKIFLIDVSCPGKTADATQARLRVGNAHGEGWLRAPPGPA